MLLCSKTLGHPPGGLKFDCVPLPVVEGKAIACETVLTRYREARGGIEAAAQQTDCAFPVQASV
jgi:hypothetical protein